MKNETKITDIDMPFLSMVAFMIKWALATIPAILMLWIIFGLTLVIFRMLIF